MSNHRLLLTGVSSGCGKTTVTCGILQALVNRGMKVGAFKCGPDYIDPMFHSRIIGAKSANLDLQFFSENTLRCLLAQGMADRDVSIIEGVMGYYDGAGLTSTRASSYEIAAVTETPVVLVVNAKGATLSVLAVIQGFLTFRRDSRIRGIILNQCTASTYALLSREIEAQFPVKCLGYLPKVEEAALESRHLGLVTAGEVENLREKMQLLAAKVEQCIDLDGLLALGAEAPGLEYTPIPLPVKEKVRIAVAMDNAFSFYYEDNLRALEGMGGEIVPFSPMEDTALPEHIQGLYLGGGYPELYARALSKNASMRRSIRQALEGKLPCIAECGGFMYLTEEIDGQETVGFLPGKCYDTGRLTRFGYVTLEATQGGILCPAGGTFQAHEFHHWDCTAPGADFVARKTNGRSWNCAVTTPWLYAGYPHIHFYSDLKLAENFYDACIKWSATHRNDHPINP